MKMKIKSDMWDGFDFQPVTKPFPKKKSLPEKKHKESFIEKVLKFFNGK